MSRCCTCRLGAPEVAFSKGSRKCKGCQAAYMKIWYAKPANRDRMIARVVAWIKENPEAAKKHRAASHARRDLQACRLRGKAWRDQNKERMAELKRRWHEHNPQKATQYNHQRRARGAEPLPPEVIRSVFDRDGHCLRCLTTEKLTLDHIVPLSRGGTNDQDNLQTLCRGCNGSKGVHIRDYRPVGKGTVEEFVRNLREALAA